MINKYSTKEELLEHVSMTKILSDKKDKISKQLSHRREKMANIFNDRFSEVLKEENKLATYEVNDELNLVLRDTIKDNRVVIMIPSSELYQKKCVSRSYGFKTYKCWGACSLNLEDMYLIKNKLQNKDVSRYYDFSVLVGHKLVDQKKIKHWFSFLQSAIKIYKEYDDKIESLRDPNNKYSVDTLHEKFGQYSDIDEMIERIEKLDTLDKLYSKYKIRLASFGKIQKEYLEEIQKYNQPFKTLVQLQESA